MFNDLCKGRFFTKEELESIVKINRDENTDGYQLAVLGLMTEIERHMKSSYDLIVTCTLTIEGLKICTDLEASGVNIQRARKGIKSLGRCFKRQKGVDISKFTPLEVKIHDRSLEFIGKVYQATKTELRKFNIDYRSSTIRKNDKPLIKG